MKESVYDELIRLSLKRELTAEERLRMEACLAAHPERRDELGADIALGQTLRSLPDVGISSNFTACVMEAIELEDRMAERQLAQRPRWRRWLQPRLGWGFALAVGLAFSAYEYRAHQMVRMAQDIQSVSHELASLPPSLPSPEIFKDFDAIDQLRQVSVTSDDDLLKVLQQ